MAEVHTIALVSDFNLQNFAALLQKLPSPFPLRAILGPFGQTASLLLDPNSFVWKEARSAIIWTQPQVAVPTFQKVASFQEFNSEELLREVDSFAELIRNIPSSVTTVLIPTWIAPELGRGLGSADLVHNMGVTNTLMRMNLRLAEILRDERRITILDANRWLWAGGPDGYSPKLWHMAKIPFHAAVLQEAARDTLAAIEGSRGKAKKIVILDLDNTLWGGIVGDIGWEKLRLGGHDPVGEAYVSFQHALRRLVNRGTVLAIASKNEEAVALEAIRSHPEMILKIDHFAGWRINWHDKAENIAELLRELNLGQDAAVFLDDNPVERARVRDALPHLLVPDFPADPVQYATFLSNLRCFDSPVVSKEDRSRTRMYVQDRQRTALKAEVGSLEQWLKLLDCHVTMELLQDSTLERAAQLLNKTNQMNLRTRRLSAAELKSWAEAEDHRLWTFRVADKFGDYGLCGIVSLQREGHEARLMDFILSCRVMGRGVEETMLAASAREANAAGCTELVVEYLPTPKNKPCEQWLEKQATLRRAGEGHVYRASSLGSMEPPPHVRVFSAAK